MTTENKTPDHRFRDSEIKRERKNKKAKKKRIHRKVNISKLTKISFLPSIFTVFGLFIGFLALFQILKGNFKVGVFLLATCVIIDGFDGTIARATKTESNFGFQLDSIVDAVSFGLVSSVLIYVWGFSADFSEIGKVTAFVFLSAGVIRLARYNVLKEANPDAANIFVGLPIPLGSLSISSIVLLIEKLPQEKFIIFIFSIYVFLISFLMISNIKYRTLKKLDARRNIVLFFLGTVVIACAIIYPTYTIPLGTAIYLISPLFFHITEKFKKRKKKTTISYPDQEINK